MLLWMRIPFVLALGVPAAGRPAHQEDAPWGAAALAEARVESVLPGGLVARIDACGLAVHALDGGGHLRLTMQGYGVPGDVRELPPARWLIDGGRAVLARPDLHEWYRLDARGLEQGFTLFAPPPHAGPRLAEVVLALALDTDLEPELAADRRGLHLRDGDGRRRIAYSGLLAWDADGRPLAASLALAGVELHLIVGVAGARWPVTIDPLIQAESTRLTQALRDSAYGDGFGACVATDGASIVVGANFEDDFGTNAGAGYVFVPGPGGWEQQAKLAGDDTGEYHRFGRSAAVDGDTLAIGADWHHEAGAQSGAAYVFVRSGTSWSQQQRLTPPDRDAFDHFGWALALEGERLVVSATEPGWPGTFAVDHGTLYVYGRTAGTWGLTATLRASDGQDYDFLGHSLALHGNRIVAGAPGWEGPLLNQGAAYVFEHDGTNWVETARLAAADPASQQAFGSAVGLDGDWLVVGAPGDPQAGSQAGAAYVFRRQGSGWIETQKLIAGNAQAFARFGSSVALDGDLVLIGAREDDSLAPNAGATYVFRRSGEVWLAMTQLVPSEGQAGDQFGSATALAGSLAVVGAELGDPEFWLPDAGKAYVFELFAALEPYCATAPNSVGPGASIAVSGRTSLSANDLVLEVTRAVPGQFGLFYYGPNAVQVPFGDGLRCVGGGGIGTFRMYPALVADAQGGAQRQLDFGSPPSNAGAGAILPGSSWNFQFWYRDPAFGGAGFNLSDALRLTFDA